MRLELSCELVIYKALYLDVAQGRMNGAPNETLTSREAAQNVQKLVIYKAFCLNVAQGRMNGAPKETRTHSLRFSSLANL